MIQGKNQWFNLNLFKQKADSMTKHEEIFQYDALTNGICKG